MLPKDTEQFEKWLGFIQQAPEGFKEYFVNTFWLFVFLVIVLGIIKILRTNDFKALYAFIGAMFKGLGRFLKLFFRGAISNLETTRSYPRLKRGIEIIFMVNNYAAAMLFASYFSIVFYLLITLSELLFLQRLGLLAVLIVLGYFAWFCVVQAENDRDKLF